MLVLASGAGTVGPQHQAQQALPSYGDELRWTEPGCDVDAISPDLDHRPLLDIAIPHAWVSCHAAVLPGRRGAVAFPEQYPTGASKTSGPIN